MWYTIESTEDWLSRLAARYLDDPMRYMEIYNMNKDVLTSGPNVVRPGMTLWIPVDGKPKPTTANVIEPEYKNLQTGEVKTPAIKAGFGGVSMWLILGGATAAILAFFLSSSPKKKA